MDDPLLRAVCDNPPDDTVRLAYADHLDEQGLPERAEFIRLQVWRAANKLRPASGAKVSPSHRCTVCGALWHQVPETLWWTLASESCAPCCDNNPEFLDVIAPLAPDDVRRLLRERELLVYFPAAPYWNIPPALTETHPHRGLGAAGQSLIFCHGSEVREVRCLFDRGFVRSVQCEMADWIAAGPEFVALHPVERVLITNVRVWREDGAEQYGFWDDATRVNFGEDQDGGYLPTPLFDAVWDLFPKNRHEDEFGRWMIWVTEAAAVDALSDGCISWALDTAEVPS